MNIAKTCIQHKVATLLATILVVVFGMMFGSQLQMALMPTMEMPMAVVMTTYVGATPSDIEELVTDPLESAIMSVSGVDEIESTSAENVSTIMITYVEGTDTDIAATKLREKFDMLTLPEDASDPMIINMNINEMMPSALIALEGKDLSRLQTLAEDVISPALERIDGVAQAEIQGGLEQQIAVELNSGRAASLGLSNAYISQFLAGQNLLYPGGEMDNGNKTLSVSTDAKFKSVEDVANTLITLPTGGTVRLSEVANVYLEEIDPAAVAESGNVSAVVMTVSKQSEANEMEVALAVEKRLAELKEENPEISYSIPYIASDYISEAVNSAFQNIIQGVFLAALMVFLFLRRGAATMTICISMPVCIMAVFVLMKGMDLTLNMMSIGGIAMGVGMIVDNSIVVLENISRFSSDGCDRMTACMIGTGEVTLSVIASTLTTMAVFVPLGLTEGMAGDMFRDFCLTIASLIAASLIISLTLVPLLCYFMLDEEKVRRHQKKQMEKKSRKKPGAVKEKVTQLLNWLNEVYLRLLNFFIRHLKIGMVASVVMVILFCAPVANSRMVLMPEMDQGTVKVDITLPIGSEVEEAAAIADRVGGIVKENCPELEDLYYIAQAESVTMGIMLVDRDQRSRSAFEIEDALRPLLKDIAGCEISVDASGAGVSAGMSSGDDINVEIEGEDLEVLAVIAEELTHQIGALPDAVNVESSVSEKVPQVKVYLNREAAAQYGLTAAGVGAAVRAELTGAEATEITMNNKEYTVMVKGDGTTSASMDALRSMPIATAYGGAVPLSAVAEVTIEQMPQSVTRVNQNRQVTVTGDTISGDTNTMTKQINAILAEYELPEGYTAETSGANEDMMESFADLGFALVVALILVYFVLAVQFESFSLPLMVMMILPTAFSGALFALPITGRDLSAISLVAIVMLAGTVVNSSIILVEYIRVRRATGESREEAILKACPLRVRPIMMTTLTTVLAMAPMALGIGETNEMMSDMGVVMISGMVISTVVTLVFTPVYYSVIDDLSHKFKRKKPSLQAG